MKIVRFGEPGQEKPGIIDSDNNIRDLSGEVTDITGEFLEAGGLSKLAQLDIIATSRPWWLWKNIIRRLKRIWIWI